MWKVSVFITLCCLFIGTAHAASIDCNIDECRKPMKIYEELGCKPIYGSKSCCPKRFECPDDMKVVKDENKCTFEGIDYEIGEILPRNLTTESKCVEACICSRYEEEPAKFLCTNSDCGISSFKVPGCINIYGDLNECCSTSIVCDDEEKEKLATCWDGDVEYHEGEKFISKSNPCYECLCHKDFDNTTIIEKNSHCHKLNCEIELKYKSFIQRGCLPIFENDKCCPVDWKCFDSAKKSKKVVKRSPDEDDDDDDSSDEDDSSEDSNEDDNDDDEEIKKSKPQPTADSAKVTPLEISQFLPPFEDKTEPTSVTKEVESVKETTPQSLTTGKADHDEEVEKEIETTQKPSEETTLSSSSDEITTLAATEASSVSESVTEAINEFTISKIETTESVTETESTTLSTESTTVTTEKSKKDDSVEENEDENSKEDEEENIFGGDLKKSDDEEEKSEASSSTEAEIELTTQSSSTEVTTESTTQSTSSTEVVSESSTQSSSSTEAVSESSTQSIPEISTEEQTTAAIVEEEAEKSLDQSEDATAEIPEVTTTSFPSAEEPKIVEPESSTEAIKLTEEAKTTEPTVTISKEQELTPPVPTQIDMILTTLKELKEYVSKLTSLPTTRTSESEPPASFVNFTVSRSLPITENNEENFGEDRLDVRSIRKRSVDQKSVYIKFSNKEKGCTVGTQLYRIGEEIKTDDKCLACFCNYSPIGHCIKHEKCKST